MPRKQVANGQSGGGDYQASMSRPLSLRCLWLSMWRRHNGMQSARMLALSSMCSPYARRHHVQISQMCVWKEV